MITRVSTKITERHTSYFKCFIYINDIIKADSCSFVPCRAVCPACWEMEMGFKFPALLLNIKLTVSPGLLKKKTSTSLCSVCGYWKGFYKIKGNA